MKKSILFTFLFSIPVFASATIINPSFESGLTGWNSVNDGNFMSSSMDMALFSDPLFADSFPTDGSHRGRIHSQNNNEFVAGEYGRLTQNIDLTGIDSITFDANLTRLLRNESGVWVYGGWSDWLEASFMIDGSNAWTSTTAGLHLDIEIDTSALTGVHTIGFQSTVLSNVANVGLNSNWFQFDNLRVSYVPTPSTLVLLTGGVLLLMATRKRRISSSPV